MNKELNKKIVDFYGKTITINNLIESMKRYEDDYLKNNWTIGIININKDIEQILYMMESCNFSLDYKQSNTFQSYLMVFNYMIEKMLDDLVVYEEGISTINMILKNLELTSKPHTAFICSRVRDLNLKNEIPASLLGLYNKIEEEGIDELKKVDMSNIFDFAFETEEDLYDDYLDTIREELTSMFGENYSLEDFTAISDIMAEYAIKKNEESSVIKDF